MIRAVSMGRSRTGRAALAAIVAVAALWPWLSHQPASAKCQSSTGVTETIVISGGTYGTEIPGSGTCDSDTWYAFTLKDGPTPGYGCIELRFYEHAGTVLLTRFTCSASGVSTHYDDTNSVTLQRFRTTSPIVYSGYEYGYGH
jgi:hypothetical protein